jgi:hypothetical protein
MRRAISIILVGMLIVGLWSASTMAFSRIHNTHVGHPAAGLMGSMCGAQGCDVASVSCMNECVRSAIAVADWSAVLPVVQGLLAITAAVFVVFLLVPHAVRQQHVTVSYRNPRTILTIQKRE